MTFLQDFISPCDQEYKTEMIDVTSQQYKIKKDKATYMFLRGGLG